MEQLAKNFEDKIEYAQERLLEGWGVKRIEKNFMQRYTGECSVVEFREIVMPSVRNIILNESKAIEEKKEFERLKGLHRLNERMIELEELLQFEIVEYKKCREKFDLMKVADQKKMGFLISNANISRIFSSFLTCQERINKLLGLEEISVNLIKSSISRIPNLTDEELFGDLKKIMAIRGYLPEVVDGEVINQQSEVKNG